MNKGIFIILLILLFQFPLTVNSDELTYYCRDNPVLFMRTNYEGKYLKLTKSIGTLNVYGFGSKASSLCVPEGWELTVYKDEGYCSAEHHIKGPAKIPDLKTLSPDLNSWNDAINSVKVISPDPNNTPFGELAVVWAGVIDNAEGTGFPHGPYGNLHILIYDADLECPENQKKYPEPLRHIVLPGPHSTGKKCEWDDGDQRKFDSLNLFEWRSEEDKVLIFIYESDGKTHGKDWDHDPLFCKKVERVETLESRIFESSLIAQEDAIERAIERNTEGWVRRILPRGQNEGIGKMFIELETVPRAATYNERKK